MGVSEQTSGEDLMDYIGSPDSSLHPQPAAAPIGTALPTDDTTLALPTESLPAGSVNPQLQMPPLLVHRDETPPMGDNNSTLQTRSQFTSRVDPPQLLPSRLDLHAVTQPEGADNLLPLLPSPPAPHVLTRSGAQTTQLARLEPKVLVG